MRDNERTNKQTVKIELLSQWKLEAEFRNEQQALGAPLPCICQHHLDKRIHFLKAITFLQFGLAVCPILQTGSFL